jgi:hypothetical protein
MQVAATVALAALLACSDDDRSVGLFGTDGDMQDGGAHDGGPDTGGGSGGPMGDGGDTASSADASGNDTLKLDVGPDSAGDATAEGGEPCDPDTDPRCECSIPAHEPCDAGTGDPFAAMGLNCPGEFSVTASTMGSAEAIGVRTGFGPTPTFDPREGSTFAVIGSGIVADLDEETPDADGEFDHDDPTHCNDDLGMFDPGNMLPPPLDPTNVGAQDCAQDPTLVGTGDCSNTLQEQWDQAGNGGCVINGVPCGVANDYTELRIVAQVPPDVVSFSYDLAFFTVEWPAYFGSQYNDLYIGWLESEAWTGNISFDELGHPISLNAAFFDFLDQDGDLPELTGTCMRHHGGTKWLTTTAGVTPGEQITVVFAILDLSDSILDSFVFLDNFQWGCDPTMKPETEPEG